MRSRPVPGRRALLELCLESVDSAMAAERGGADRVELCANLLEGGTTPSAGAIREARARLSIRIHVMIRPRGGDFLYTDAEFASMRHDIRVAKDLGADGVVLGLLHADGTVDVPRTRELVELASPLPVTFHRAIDVSRDLPEALEAIIGTGAARVLTSGGKPSVIEGLSMVAQLARQAGDRIVVMPGCGIRQENVREVLERTGAREIHIALETGQPSGMAYRRPEISMGGVEGREYERFLTPQAAVEAVVERLEV